MLFSEAFDYLKSLHRFGMKPGLERTTELLRRLGRPDRRVGRIIHITGTSGKGSVAAMVEASLRAAGNRVGLYTSPSMERFTDRIQVDRREITREAVAGLIAQVRLHVEAMVAEGHEQPTEFEVVTTIAFLYFERQQLDWLVLEVGLGGRFDATTAIEKPAITCITNIGLDHTHWLGDTHEQIAWDKAGIIKPAIACVTGAEHPGALAVIREVALANHVDLTEVTAADWRINRIGPGGQVIDLAGRRGWYRDLSLSLLGRHQAANAAVALRVLELAGVGEECIRAGLGHVFWPGRMELFPQPNGLIVMLDAAHNPAKCNALAESMREYFPDRNLSLVLGILADKHAESMLQPLLHLATGGVWATTAQSPRALPAPALAAICASLGRPASVVPGVGEAVQQAIQEAGPSDLVLVTGSFYLVGPARSVLSPVKGQE